MSFEIVDNAHIELKRLFLEYKDIETPLSKIPVMSEIIDQCVIIDQSIIKLPFEKYDDFIVEVAATLNIIEKYLEIDMNNFPDECVEIIMNKYYQKVGYKEIKVNNVIHADFQNKRLK